MLIYDGRGDKLTPKTDRTLEVISSNKILSGDHMTIRKNGRGDFSLFFIEMGKMTFDDVILNKNQIWIYPPDEKQLYFTYEKDKTAYYYIHFTGNNIKSLVSSLQIPLKAPIDFPFDKEIFCKIRDSVFLDDALSKVKSEYLTLNLLSLLARLKPQPTTETMMKAVLDEMHHSYFLPYDAKSFAKMLSLSESRFNHLFKETVGVSPQSYYNNIRMENASILLKETKLSITEIAIKTGFSDPLYFGQRFKKFFGVSPSNYR